MRGLLLLTAFGLALSGSALAQEDATSLGTPLRRSEAWRQRPTRNAVDSAPRSQRETPAATPRGSGQELPEQNPETETENTAPRLLGEYATYSLPTAGPGGRVHGFAFAPLFPTGRLRLGPRLGFATRQYPLGENDLVIRADALIGYQHLSSSAFVPYLQAFVGGAFVFTRRISVPIREDVFFFGAELGTDIRLHPKFFFGVGLSLQFSRREVANGTSLGLHVRVGF